MSHFKLTAVISIKSSCSVQFTVLKVHNPCFTNQHAPTKTWTLRMVIHSEPKCLSLFFFAPPTTTTTFFPHSPLKTKPLFPLRSNRCGFDPCHRYRFLVAKNMPEKRSGTVNQGGVERWLDWRCKECSNY